MGRGGDGLSGVWCVIKVSYSCFLALVLEVKIGNPTEVRLKAEELQKEPDAKVYVCPKCKAELCISNEACASCGLSMKVNGSGSLWIDGAIFPDHDHEEALKAFGSGNYDYYNRDEQINKRFIDDFSVPLLERLYGSSDKCKLRILSVGCGVGIDVDMLRELGYDAWGSDCGSRCLFWPKRRFPEYLVQCTDETLPFHDNFFDFVMCHQVLEHVGVVGDTIVTHPDCRKIRQSFLNNLLRVTKPGGYINVATPNRTFPIDPGHAANFCGVRIHGPFDYFLTSYSDMRRYFAGQEVKALSPDKYYAGTCTGNRGRLGVYFKNYLKFLDRFPALQGTCLNPLTNVLIRKTDRTK